MSAKCLICRGATPAKGAVKVFGKDVSMPSGKPLSAIVSQLVDREITESSDQSQLICKKCLKICSEVDALQSRVSQIKFGVKNTLNTTDEQEQEDGEEGSEENVDDKSKVLKVLKQTVPKKILDIPSSDDDSAAHVKKIFLSEDHAYENFEEAGDKQSFHTIEDIEMELVKMHGDDGEAKEVVIQSADGQTFTRVFQTASGLIATTENSTDSEYDGVDNTDEILVQAAAGAERMDVRVKLEPEDNARQGTSSGETVLRVTEKPNILKKRMAPLDAKAVAFGEESAFEDPIVERDGNVYTCLLCEGDETVAGVAKAIIAHLKTEHGARLYICDVCGCEFRKRNELSAHLDEHMAQEEGDFQCEVCNRIFNNLRQFRIHRRMHYPHNKAWECEHCGKKYSSKNLLDEHVNTHLGLRPYMCQSCGKSFASKYTYKAHEKTHAVRPRPYRCQQCPKTFLSQQNLSQHEKTHTGVKEYSCHLCNKQFGSMHNLEVHSIVHTGVKPFVCKQCGKKFARKAEIRDHERTHTGERPFQCEMCGATFSQRSNLQSHKRATHYDDKRYICTDCGRGFKRRRLLDYHIKAAHTGERPFKCDVCEATFVYPEHFKKHRRIHTGEKPFRCEVCGKAFNSRDNRNAHRFVHSDKKPYECPDCGAGFMRKPLLYQHMQSQGHLNDIIVVNQPRLTTDDDQLVTVNADGEMEIVEAAQSAVADSKLYIAHEDGTEHIIIDGQRIKFATDTDEEEDGEDGAAGSGGEIVDEIEQVVVGEAFDGDIIPEEALEAGETQFIDTEDGPIQIVKVKITNNEGVAEDTWIKIVPE